MVRGEGKGWCAHALAFQGALARAGRGTANHASPCAPLHSVAESLEGAESVQSGWRESARAISALREG